MADCSVCGPVEGPLADHVISHQHQTLAAMDRDLRHCTTHHDCDEAVHCRCMRIVCDGSHRCACGHEW